MGGNLDNISKITRMQKVLWPQFSWQSVPGDESSRIYEMFAKDISRIGYDDTGRIWSIICPQRGVGTDLLGTMMLEVRVTGVQGWVDEPSRDIYAKMGVEGMVWFENPAEGKNPLLTSFEERMDKKNFPFSKANAIRVNGHMVGKPYEEFWPMVNGTDPTFFHPKFCKHWDEAFSVSNLKVEIGKQVMTGDELLDNFNEAILNIFNLVKGNILMEGQVVAWNVWFGEPELVDTAEWENHAKKWLHSITVEHEYPEGDAGTATFYDGTPFEPTDLAERNLRILKEFVTANWNLLKSVDKPDMIDLLKDHLWEKKRTHIKDMFKK